MATQGDPQEVFREAVDEIRRRSASKRELETSQTTHFAASSNASNAQPFELPGQRMALVSFGTAVMAPRPVDVTNPSIRVYGVFERSDDVLDHYKVVKQLDENCSFLTVPMREWCLLPTTTQSRDDIDERAARTQFHLARIQKQREKNDIDFDKRLSDGGEASHSSMQAPEEDDEETREAEREIYKPPKRLPSGGEVRGQNFVCLAIVRDPDGGECLVQVLGVFDTVSEADSWVQDVASRHICEHDIVVAPTCEWLYPNRVVEDKEQYRVPELQRIMDAQKVNTRRVVDYKKWKEKNPEGVCSVRSIE